MSTASSEPAVKRRPALPTVPWNPWWGIVFALVLFYAAQLVAGVLVSVYPALKHWSNSEATSWLNNSVAGQFVYVLLAETFTVGGVYLCLKRFKLKLSAIGLNRPRWTDPVYALAAAPVYFIGYLIAITIIGLFYHNLNVNQTQQIGFDSVHGAGQMIMTFISLVILPPLAEEIMVRGFIYSSLKKGMKLIPAAIVTSLLFAAAHLPEGGAAGPLYIGAIDTFILSLVLIYLREKTGSLWAGICLHALKNGVAFATLFIGTAR